MSLLPVVPVEKADIRIRDNGATFLVRPTSPAGAAWIADRHDTLEDGSVAVPARHLDELFDAADAGGLRFGPHDGPARLDAWPGEWPD